MIDDDLEALFADRSDEPLTREELAQLAAEQQAGFAKAAAEMHRWIDRRFEESTLEVEQRIREARVEGQPLSPKLIEQALRFLGQDHEAKRAKAHADLNERLEKLEEMNGAMLAMMECGVEGASLQ